MLATTSASRRLTSGAAIVVLLMILGGVMGARGPVAHAEPVGCYTSQIGYKYLTLFGTSGYLEARHYAKYRTSDTAYCGEMWSEARLHLNPGAAWGTLTASLYDCSGHVKATASRSANGGGGSGQDYYLPTAHLNLACGHSEGYFSFTSGGVTYGTVARTPNRYA